MPRHNNVIPEYSRSYTSKIQSIIDAIRNITKKIEGIYSKVRQINGRKNDKMKKQLI